jgi:transcription termination factor Rho
MSNDTPAEKPIAKKRSAKKAASIHIESTTEPAKKITRKRAIKVAQPVEALINITPKKRVSRKVEKDKISSSLETEKNKLPEEIRTPKDKIVKESPSIITADQKTTIQVVNENSQANEIQKSEQNRFLNNDHRKKKNFGREREPQNRNSERNGNFQKNQKSRNNGQNRFIKPTHHHKPNPDGEYANAVLSGELLEISGLLEIIPKGGFIRLAKKNYEQLRDDVFVPSAIVNRFGLRNGSWLIGQYQMSQRGPILVELTTVNDLAAEDVRKLPHFDELKAINPTKRIPFETEKNRFTTRVLDIIAPVGKGQRGLIVSPPRSGKTTLLLHIAEAIRQKEDENMHLLILLIDERPEEVTEFRRTLPGAEIMASSNDDSQRNHCRIAELAIERAKRLVEAGKDVFLLMDSITRLARAYNGQSSSNGRGVGTGGVTVGALEIPRRLFAAARNTRGGGSLTILATALIQTNSRADEAIFQEFKGTGNMELVLDRKIAENYIYPAVDIFKSGTRREELLLPEHMIHKIHLIRRGLSGHKPLEAMERLSFFLKKFPSNAQMLMEIKG